MTKLHQSATALLSRTLSPAFTPPRIFGLQIRHKASVVDDVRRFIPQLTSNSGKPSYEPATLSIRGGPTFRGNSFGARSDASGEAVFTTSLVGYPESMTDPSYRGQILVFTQPLIGNYGVPSSSARDEYGLLRYLESTNIHPSGIVVGDLAHRYSHWSAVESLSEWCAREGVPGVTGVDTREIVTFLRERGSSLANITVGRDHVRGDEYQDSADTELVKNVSTKLPYYVPSGYTAAPHIALIDCGVKENIIRSIVSRGASITCLPYDYPIHQMAENFDGVFISNGPGDPTKCSKTSQNLRNLMNLNHKIPIMGICLGHQLLAIAAGAKTIKMKYGNRAHNIPALEVDKEGRSTGRCHITSQNHGYAVEATTLPPEFCEYFRNLNDGSNEGIMHKERPIFSTQFHPEAKGGPMDTSYLFDVYLENVQEYRQHKHTQDLLLKPTKHEQSIPMPLEVLTEKRVDLEEGDNVRLQI
ncbi:hypothetical protein M409DRAFT_35990 [Zasmidium cellare ATCC 36951]|uniref:Carbamoyl phosphate synthase arginine-specific small chain n=1 Tax=Zasmidium cellare ATCC 36951 TaxID=1080233 RepID=A0A6A6CUW2_ZASCE|nr:uncharacterized protein M409DRAFT_35990 [Zasmidium cellare ATCC 36951]KAF2169978.1 hypothetical protein M409DRAFT_35990 [Zasmidium cellare ATCC 36951]